MYAERRVEARSTRCGENIEGRGRSSAGTVARADACENDAAWVMRWSEWRSGGNRRACLRRLAAASRLVYVKSRMLIPIAMHATDTHGLNRSPMRAHFQNVPRKLFAHTRHTARRSRQQEHESAKGESRSESNASTLGVASAAERRCRRCCASFLLSRCVCCDPFL